MSAIADRLSSEEVMFNYWLLTLGQIFSIKSQNHVGFAAYSFSSEVLYCDTCMLDVIPYDMPWHEGHAFIDERPRYI